MSYWRRREQEHIKRMIKNDKEIARRIRQKHIEAMNEIQDQIDAFYGRFADSEGLTMAEARKRARKLDIKRYAKKAERYVKQAHSSFPFIRAMAFTDKANTEMRIYNLVMRVSRLELLKLNIELELAILLDDEEKILSKYLSKSARAEYERQAGILGETLNFNEKHIRTIVNSSFLSATWSERLWSNQDALRSELDRLLTRGIVQGVNPRVLARDLRKTFETSVFNSERLLITELGRVQTQVQEDSFNQAGYDEYEYVAQLDDRTSEVCRDLDGKRFKVKDMMPGENAPPMHPYCRSSVSAYMSRAKWDADLKSRGL